MVRAHVGPQEGGFVRNFPLLFLKMANTYIIYSLLLDKYYVGACHEHLQNRIKNHNSGKYGLRTFTSQTQDWKLFLSFECVDYPHAVRLERKIKSMKSRKYILNLLKYPKLPDLRGYFEFFMPKSPLSH